MSKICPYVQNQSVMEEKYTYTEDGQVDTFKQKIVKCNAVCTEEECAVWNNRTLKCEYKK